MSSPSPKQSVHALIFATAAAIGGLTACADVSGDSTEQAAAAITSDGSHDNGRRPHQPPRVIFDTDMDFDDASALAYLAQAHKLGQIRLDAVTVTNDGAGFPGSAIRNARCILQAAGLTSIPVADGSPTGVNSFPLDIRFGVEFVLGTAFASCTASGEASVTPAPQVIADEIEATNGDVTLITTGPLTNVASALSLIAEHRRHHGRASDPASLFRGSRLSAYVMGGAIRVPGNLCCGLTPTFDNTQELNIWSDPLSARGVLDALSGGEPHIVPLDATQHTPITHDFVTRLQADSSTAEAQIVSSIVGNPLFGPAIDAGQLFWWDPLTAVEAVRGGVVSFERLRIDVVQDGPSAGRTIEVRHASSTSVGLDGNQARFESIFLDTLNGRE